MTTRYQSTAQHLLDKAREALAQGDLLQASEKGWGAAAQITKAVGQSRGWPHTSHRLLFETMQRLVDETGDRTIRQLFMSGHGLHINFYEQTFGADLVAG